MIALGALLGGVGALGVLLIVSGLTPTEIGPKKPRPAARPGRQPVTARNVVFAVAGAAFVGLVTRWPVGAAGGALAGWFAPRMLGGGRRARRADTDRIRALAAWASLLRDGFAGVGMLQSTIAATEKVAPRPIRPEVQRLCVRMRSSRPGSVERALRLFAAEMADETADMVVTALLLAATGTSSNLAEILSTLADTAEKEVASRLEIEAKRADVFMERRLILGAVIASTAFMLIFRSGYLKPFSTAAGQVAVSVIVGLFAVSLWYMDRLARLLPPERTMQPERQLLEPARVQR